MPPVKDDSIREENCLEIINIAEKSPAKSGALVDVRACNKPAAKVSDTENPFYIECYVIFILLFTLKTCLLDYSIECGNCL